VHACVSPEQTLLARYPGYLLTEFDQTFSGDESLVEFVARMKVSNFAVKRSRSRRSQVCPKMHILAL